MSEESQARDLASKRVVVQLPEMESVVIERDLVYGGQAEEPLTLDLYHPPGTASSPPPVVLFVTGYPDNGFRKLFGCSQKEIQSYISWAKLVASTGLAGVCYSNLDPAKDAMSVFRFLQRQAASLGLDGERIGIWSSSGNVPTALSILTGESGRDVKCATLVYGCMLDRDGSQLVASLANQFGFANPCAGKTVTDLPTDLPLMLVRAGQDTLPGLNTTMDGFVSHALAANLPFTLINHASGPHAFDLLEDSRQSREIVHRILRFLRFHLTGQGPSATA